MTESSSTASVASHLGASASNQRLVILFIPSKDRNGKELKDSDMWVDSAIKILSKQFGGATVMAPAQGAWYNPQTRKVIRECYACSFLWKSRSEISLF